MGIIIKQSIKGTIWSYLGVIIGFVTTAYLYPNYLTTDVVGLFGLLISYSALFGQFSLLGMPGITARLFPLFRDKESKHHGFLFLSLIFVVIGFSLFLLVYFAFSPLLAENNLEKSRLFSDYLFLLVPLTFFTMVFILLDTYNKVLYDAVFGTFLQEFLQRAIIFAGTLLFAFKVLNLNQLIICYAAAICVKGIAMILFLYSKGELSLRPQLNFIDTELRKEIIDVALFSILGGLGYMLVFNIDKIVINQMLDLGNTGVYTIAFYFGSLVIIPSRPLLKISGTLIADAWATNDRKKIEEIYYKSCINQFIIGGFLYLAIWANIDNILTILGEDYAQSKWVIFFIGLGYLFDMMTGANTHVISYSKYYRISLTFTLILIALVILLLYLFIPLWGITGAAIAIAIALFANNLMRYFFLYAKYNLQPFNRNFIFVIIFNLILYLLTQNLPGASTLPDIFIKGSLITVCSLLFYLYFDISPDIKGMLIKLLNSFAQLKK